LSDQLIAAEEGLKRGETDRQRERKKERKKERKEESSAELPG
jgi:hypothetical protein